MGPLLDSSGETASCAARGMRPCGFNGAAARQQRRARRRWRARAGRRRFNGAAARQQRRAVVPATRTCSRRGPSLQWGRCSTAAERSRRAVGAGAPGGGAASMGPLLESSGGGSRRRWSTALQWGRCSTAAESGVAGHARDRGGRASMGPLLDSSGVGGRRRRRARSSIARASMGPLLDSSGELGRVGRMSSPPLVAGLQWGRCSTAAESRAVATATDALTWLQWGRCSTAAESRAPRRPPGRDRHHRFNGAAARQQRREFAPGLPPRRILVVCFNGAAARQQRRVGAAAPGRSAHRRRPLQWGRWLDSSGEAARCRRMRAARCFNGAAARQQRGVGPG